MPRGFDRHRLGGLPWLVMAVMAVVGAACGDDDPTEGCTGGECVAECTQAEQGVEGTALTFSSVDLQGLPPTCDERLLTSDADVLDLFPNGDAPTTLTEVDFTTDRVVIHVSNPAILFVVDDGTDLVVGAEPLCQGELAGCRAYIAAGTSRDSLRAVSCPYRGPNPCNAP